MRNPARQSDILLYLPSCFAAAMVVPAIYAFLWGSDAQGRAFLYGAILLAVVLGFVRVARNDRTPSGESQRLQLLTAIAIFLALPAILAIPFAEALGTTDFLTAYLEMISALTTTGLPIFDPDTLSPALHLWRAIVAWGGGFIMWVIAWSIFAPLNMGGYEHLSRGKAHLRQSVVRGQSRTTSISQRFKSEASRLAPAYLSLTAGLFLLLLATGTSPFDAALYAMGILSTSGIQAHSADVPLSLGLAGEVSILLFLLFAFSRAFINAAAGTRSFASPRDDNEFKLALVLVAAVSLLFVTQHFVGAAQVSDAADTTSAMGAIWGAVFTSASFLATAGYVSDGWTMAQNWSGASNQGLILMGLALIGGGAATTAGGIKLMRVGLLVNHSRQELLKLVSPSQVVKTGGEGMNLTVVAWVFFMVFAVSLAGILLLLTFTGTSFEEGLILTIACLSNTGPVAAVAGDTPVQILDLSGAAKTVLGFAMVLGRLETLVFVALLNPELWR